MFEGIAHPTLHRIVRTPNDPGDLLEGHVELFAHEKNFPLLLTQTPDSLLDPLLKATTAHPPVDAGPRVGDRIPDSPFAVVSSSKRLIQ